jgi:hypothetical protein
MTRRLTTAALALALLGGGATAAEAKSASLRGSRAQMLEQNQVAKTHDLAFYRSTEDIRAAVTRGDLLELRGDANYDVADFVRHPYAHPAAVLFVERLAAQYHEACGQKLVVTSAVRPSNGQPRNAHELSVHPAGMALDLRVSDRATCRAWLEDTLMDMERRGLLNGIREHHPPHYHVAIYPEPYMAYATEQMRHEPVPAPVVEEAAVVAAAEPEQILVAAALGVETVLPLTQRLPLAAAVVLLLAVPMGGQMMRGRRGRSHQRVIWNSRGGVSPSRCSTK